METNAGLSPFFIPRTALTCGDVKQTEISKFAMHKTYNSALRLYYVKRWSFLNKAPFNYEVIQGSFYESLLKG